MASLVNKLIPRHAVTYRTKDGRVQFKPKMSFVMGMREPDRGFCLACAAEAHDVEPDAQRLKCEACGELKVYGLEQLVLMGLVFADV